MKIYLLTRRKNHRTLKAFLMVWLCKGGKMKDANAARMEQGTGVAAGRASIVTWTMRKRN